MSLKRFVLVLLFNCILPCIAASNTTSTTTQPSQITTTEIQSQLDSLTKNKLPETDLITAKTALEQALQFTAKRDEYTTKLTNLKNKLEEAPKEIAEYRKQLEKLTATPKKDISVIAKNMTDTELQQYFTNNNTNINTWQTTLIELNNSLLHAQTRPEQIQSQLSTLQTRLQEITTQLTSDTNIVTPENRLKLQAEQTAINAQGTFLRQELMGSSTIQELYSHYKNLLSQQTDQAVEENKQLQAIISERRQTATEQSIKNMAQTTFDQSSNTLLNDENKTNLKLLEYLLQSTSKLNSLSTLNLQVNSQLDSTKHINDTLGEQIRALKGSILLSKILYQQKKSLPTIIIDSSLANEIGTLRLYQFQLNQQREAFVDPNTYVNKLLASKAVDTDTQKQLLTIAKKRDEIYSSLQRNLTDIINEAVNLQLAQKQLITTTNQISETIDKQMFWIPSNPPLNLDWFKKSPSLLKKELNSNWYQSITDMGSALTLHPLLFLPLAFIILILTIKRNSIAKYLKKINTDIGNVKHDSQLHTPLAILLNILLALPITLALALAGIVLLLDEKGLNYAYGCALLQVAFGWLIFYTAYRVLSPESIATTHFHWNKKTTAIYRRQIVQLGIISLLLMVVVTISGKLLDNIANDVIGVMITIACFLIMAILLAKALLKRNILAKFNLLSWLIASALILMPLILIIATTLGYYYTALKLTDRLITTLYALLIWVLIEGMFVRWLHVAARRLAYQRAIEKRQSQAQAREQGEEEVIEEPILDIETINQQTLKIIHMLLFAGLLFVLYYIWADVLAVFTYLNNITLYHYLDNNNTTLIPLSLMGFMVAIIIFIVTIFLVKNLPGVLEMLVLSKLNLSRGSSYAITTLLSYLIIGTGVSMTLGILGVSWGKLQWLVAALSVGLGFGLQEIFANFVSGIILLFERPIRIGDRITIGGVTGTVNRIQIRATRMTDGERKEVIIPNKTFVTSQVTNWTLTDTVTRITLKIGVGYNSDIDKVKQLLLQIAHNNERVIKDPAPSVTFINFGVDTLDLEFTMLVNEIADRSATIDEVNRQILKVFNAEGIDIPFHQVDITLKNSEGKELLLTK